MLICGVSATPAVAAEAARKLRRESMWMAPIEEEVAGGLYCGVCCGAGRWPAKALAGQRPAPQQRSLIPLANRFHFLVLLLRGERAEKQILCFGVRQVDGERRAGNAFGVGVLSG